MINIIIHIVILVFNLQHNKESVYVISAISKALIEIDNTMFAERIEAAAKKGNTSAQGLISIDKEEREDGKVAYNFKYSNTKVKYDEHMGVFAPYLGLDEDPYSYYKPKDEPLVDLS